jgi:hypothetical protein
MILELATIAEGADRVQANPDEARTRSRDIEGVAK